MSVYTTKLYLFSIDINYCVLYRNCPESNSIHNNLIRCCKNHLIKIWIFCIPQYWIYNCKFYYSILYNFSISNYCSILIFYLNFCFNRVCKPDIHYYGCIIIRNLGFDMIISNCFFWSL